MESRIGNLRPRRGVAQRTVMEGNVGVENDEEVEVLRKTPFAGRIEGQLGFVNWILLFLMVAILYGAVVWQGQRMPTVEPSNQHEKFSEQRARRILNQLTGLGPRPSGSEALEVHSFRIITDKIKALADVTDRIGVNRLEMDVQRPSGCFDLKFLSVFTLCYHKITNIVARIGPSGKGPTDFSILINCHYDSMPDTPGATDDAVSCAIMMEVLEIFAHLNEPLEHDILFLFNGAEENFLQASHGFITNHPWRHSIRAFINLEGSGSGGRELLFQTGPGEPWLIKTYMDNVPHPHCSVMGQEIFQLGVIPSDTDFRVFRDYGRISGFDISYIRNGWVYHTEFDRPELIEAGAIQRSGDNLLALAKALIRSPYLRQPAHFVDGTKWVFFDVVGLFTVFYEMCFAKLLNYSTIFLLFIHIFVRLQVAKAYTMDQLLAAFWHQWLAGMGMLATGLILVLGISWLDMTMSWYSTPELVFPIYILPMLTTAFWIHSLMTERLRRKGIPSTVTEKAQYDSTIVLWAIVLLFLTWLNAASSFFFLLHVFFPLLRDPLLYLLTRTKMVKAVSPRMLLLMQSVCLVPLVIIVSSYTQLLFDFFVPVMGRFGNAINPEFVVMPFSLLISSTIIMFTNNLIYISRRLNFMVKCMVAISLFGLLIIFTTSVGVPYKYSDQHPRVRRLVALHTKRSIYNFDGSLRSVDNGMFVTSLDYRGTDDLPEHTFLHGVGHPNCSGIVDEYCQLPYYTAVHELFPPERTRWVPLPAEPPLAHPLSVQLIDRKFTDGNLLNLTIAIHGGADKASLHISPLNGFQLNQWSFTDFHPSTFSTRNTYFVFMTYGHEAPEGDQRLVWILLENFAQQNLTLADVGNKPALEFAIATHYAHGQHQNSDTLIQLRTLIANRRKTPHAGVGFWRWAMTLIGANSEIVVNFF